MSFYDNSSQNILSLAGALYDIAGAIPLVRALIFVKARELYRQAISPYGGFSGVLLKMFAEQKADASFGLASLLVGFSLQALAGWGFRPTLEMAGVCWLIFALVAIFLTGVVAYLRFRKSLTRRFFGEALLAGGKSEAEIDEYWSRAQQQKEN
jgi:hypothetical protein